MLHVKLEVSINIFNHHHDNRVMIFNLNQVVLLAWHSDVAKQLLMNHKLNLGYQCVLTKISQMSMSNVILMSY